MTPTEIAQLKEFSPALHDALRVSRGAVWPFLREQVSMQYVLPCERCNTTTQLLRSPYAWDLCIDCLLHELLVGGPLMEDASRDPRARKYDAEYDKQCRSWEDFYRTPEDYDGPPIVMA